jgi:gentisate 1,2-dioxygenase
MNVNVAHDLTAQDRIARDLSAARSLEEYYPRLAAANMGAGWNKREPSLYPTPKKTFLPAHWPYRTARAALDAAARLIGTQDAERRNLILHNPLPGNAYGTAPTIVAAYQMIKATEVARSHRHTPNAMRFILETGPKAYTIVDGKKVPMEPGDVLLTPNWSWHGHSNEGAYNAYWIDFLDVPLTHLLGPVFFEQLDESFVEDAAEVAADSPWRFPFAGWGPKSRSSGNRVQACASLWSVRPISTRCGSSGGISRRTRWSKNRRRPPTVSMPCTAAPASSPAMTFGSNGRAGTSL